MGLDTEGFLYPLVDKDSCVDCHLCESVCPFSSKQFLNRHITEAYSAKSKNLELRKSSSSGGIFSELSYNVLEKGGVVFGVSMSDDARFAHHIRVDTKEELAKLRGSKYLQSVPGNIYKNVKEELDSGKIVLFSGVTCQVNALKMFLGKEYSNLLTVDVICHGVPSPKLWGLYCDYLEKKYKAKIQRVNFRSKLHGWRRFGVLEEGTNICHYNDIYSDPFMIMFLRNYSLRPSCYHCVAKVSGSMSDLTLGDFWGIEKVLPDMNDEFGISLVLVHTEKGLSFFSDLKKKLSISAVSFTDSIKFNPAYVSSVKEPTERDAFFVDIDKISFQRLRNKYCRTTFKVKLSRFYSRLFKNKRAGSK